MVSVVQAGSLSGVTAHAVLVEVSPVRGLPGFDLVGLPEAAVRESKVRVQAALSNSGFKLPEQRFVVNLAPGDLRKSGSAFDLAIAIALLSRCGMCAPNRLPGTLIVGELSLDGGLRPVRGLLSQLHSARRRGLSHAVIPQAESAWAGLVSELEVHCASHLREVVAFFEGVGELAPPDPMAGVAERSDPHLDLRDVRGQQCARRALEVAAAGGHNLLMIGPPGTGKTMLASRLPGILPPPSREEALEIATIASAGGQRPDSLRGVGRPFRSPHHTCSQQALVGGGEPIRPGEVTLAHGGVLFLDELPEFRRDALEALRPIMESGSAHVVRARDRAVMPAQALIAAAMNPCPCGHAGQRKPICRCSPERVDRYRGRISGPLMDRFDLHVALPPVSLGEVSATGESEDSASVQVRVVAAKRRAEERALRDAGQHARPLLQRLAAELEPEALRLLHRSMGRLGLSLRAYAKLLRVSRTIADLEHSETVTPAHIAEAVQYRTLDREPSDVPSRGPRAVTT